LIAIIGRLGMTDVRGNASYRALRAWQEAQALAGLVYSLPLGRKGTVDVDLIAQIRSAAVSIPSNIAEGNGRGTNKEALRFLYIARGSLHELETQLTICRTLGSLDAVDSLRLLEQTSIVGRLLGGLIRYRKERLKREQD
jgi:four helix bundle protein